MDLDDDVGPVDAIVNDVDTIFNTLVASCPQYFVDPTELNFCKSANVVTEEQIDAVLYPRREYARILNDREFELICQDIEMDRVPEFRPCPPPRKIRDDVLYDPLKNPHQVPPMIPEDEFNARNSGQLNTIGFLLNNGYITWFDYNFIYYKIRFDGVKENIVPPNYFIADNELRAITKTIFDFITSIREAKLDNGPEAVFVKFLDLCKYSEPYHILNIIYQDYKNALLDLKKRNATNRPDNYYGGNGANCQGEDPRPPKRKGPSKDNGPAKKARVDSQGNNHGGAPGSANSSARPNTARLTGVNSNFYSAPPTTNVDWNFYTASPTDNFMDYSFMNNVTYDVTNDMESWVKANIERSHFDQTIEQCDVYPPSELNQPRPSSASLFNRQPQNVSPSFGQYPPNQRPKFLYPPSINKFNPQAINNLGLNGNQSKPPFLETGFHGYDTTGMSGTQDITFNLEGFAAYNGNRINVPSAFLSQGLAGTNNNLATIANGGGTLNVVGSNQTGVNNPNYPPQANYLLQLANLQPNFGNNTPGGNGNGEPRQLGNGNYHL